MSILRAIRVLGLRRFLLMSRGYRLAWHDALRGYFTTHVVQVLLSTGFFEEMTRAGHVQPAAFAAQRGLDPDILATCCESLYAARILERHDQAFTLSRRGRILIEVGRGWFVGVYGYRAVYANLEAMLRGTRQYGQEIHRDPVAVARGSCEAESWVHFPLALKAIRRAGHQRVLDLGCGDGTFLTMLCEACPSCVGYGIDHHPSVVKEARQRVLQAGCGDRVEIAEADLRRLGTLPPAFREVDLVTIFLVLHEMLWTGEEEVVQTLKQMRHDLPSVPILIVEIIRPSVEAMRRRPGMMVQYLIQHELSRQKLIRRDQWRNLFTAAGFGAVEEDYYDFARTAVFLLHESSP